MRRYVSHWLVCIVGGHYTSYGLNYVNELWYEYDDQYVTEVSALQVQNCEAYVLFYRLVNSIRQRLVSSYHPLPVTESVMCSVCLCRYITIIIYRKQKIAKSFQEMLPREDNILYTCYKYTHKNIFRSNVFSVPLGVCVLFCVVNNDVTRRVSEQEAQPAHAGAAREGGVAGDESRRQLHDLLRLETVDQPLQHVLGAGAHLQRRLPVSTSR